MKNNCRKLKSFEFFVKRSDNRTVSLCVQEICGSRKIAVISDLKQETPPALGIRCRRRIVDA